MALQRGYTLIEMLVVMTVLGILATVAMPLVELTAKRNKERELKAAVWEIRHAIDAYKQAYDRGQIAKSASATGYPPSLGMLQSGVPVKDESGTRIAYMLRRVPRDPFSPHEVPAELSWGLRSYGSPPDQPKAGADVFDVYSVSSEVGINGVPYSQW